MVYIITDWIYSRCFLNPWHHVQPAYHDDSVPVEMHIMSWPYVFSKEEYETFRADQAGIMP